MGFIKYHWFLSLSLFGLYRRYQNIDWGVVVRLCFVCKGNICRSPYSEARARALGLQAYSCGLDTQGNKPADATAIALARNRGLDLGDFRSMPIGRWMFLPGDLLLAMEPHQAKQLRTIAADSGAQVTLLGLWHPRPRPFVQDPYGMCREYFETCFTILDESINRVAEKIASADGK
jgi:protein-tyrosine phosphatase